MEECASVELSLLPYEGPITKEIAERFLSVEHEHYIDFAGYDGRTLTKEESRAYDEAADALLAEVAKMTTACARVLITGEPGEAIQDDTAYLEGMLARLVVAIESQRWEPDRCATAERLEVRLFERIDARLEELQAFARREFHEEQSARSRGATEAEAEVSA